MAYVVDLDQICKDHFYSTQLHFEGELRGISKSELKFKCLHTGVAELWTDHIPSNPTQGPTSVVTVERNQMNLGAYGGVKTSKTCEEVASVEIIRGALKNLTGVNNKIKLPLPYHVRDTHGDTVEVDLSKDRSEHRRAIDVEVQSGQQFPKNVAVAQARISNTDEEFRGTFVCTMSMRGDVVYQLGAGLEMRVDIGDIVEGLEDGAGLEVERRRNSPKARVQWELKGSCRLVCAHAQRITWD